MSCSYPGRFQARRRRREESGRGGGGEGGGKAGEEEGREREGRRRRREGKIGEEEEGGLEKRERKGNEGEEVQKGKRAGRGGINKNVESRVECSSLFPSPSHLTPHTSPSPTYPNSPSLTSPSPSSCTYSPPSTHQTSIIHCDPSSEHSTVTVKQKFSTCFHSCVQQCDPSTSVSDKVVVTAEDGREAKCSNGTCVRWLVQ